MAVAIKVLVMATEDLAAAAKAPRPQPRHLTVKIGRLLQARSAIVIFDLGLTKNISRSIQKRTDAPRPSQR